MADVRHVHAVSPSTSFPHSALLPKHALHASARQGILFSSAERACTTHHDGGGAFLNGSMVVSYKTGRGDGESTGQHSNEAHFQCLHDSVASNFRAMVQCNEEIETSIEQLSSVCVEAVPGQPSVPASFYSCLARLGQDPSSSGDAISSAEHDWSTGGEFADHDVYPIQEGAGSLEDGNGTTACTCACACKFSCTEEIRRKKVTRGLLGESGEAIKAAHEAMKEIEAVHSSDELMHFEFCGPFWELSEV
jgi:hypothetical protein